MKTIHYTIQFFSYWHCSSGLIGGPDANATVIKDDRTLPFIPGKTLKGLIRESAENYLETLHGKSLAEKFILDVFGPKEGVFDYHNQSSFFGNATLSTVFADQIDEETSLLLYDRIASTAIDDDGQALDESLRQIEVTVPLSLEAQILDFPNQPKYEEALKNCLKGIKRMGSYRTRGLGRCQFVFQNAN